MKRNNIIFNFIHSIDKFLMQGNIKIIKSTEWTYTIIVKKFSIKKKLQNLKYFIFRNNDVKMKLRFLVIIPIFILKLCSNTKKGIMI